MIKEDNRVADRLSYGGAEAGTAGEGLAAAVVSALLGWAGRQAAGATYEGGFRDGGRHGRGSGWGGAGAGCPSWRCLALG